MQWIHGHASSRSRYGIPDIFAPAVIIGPLKLGIGDARVNEDECRTLKAMLGCLIEISSIETTEGRAIDNWYHRYWDSDKENISWGRRSRSFVTFAHYTFADFLLSERLKSDTELFTTSLIDCTSHILQAVLSLEDVPLILEPNHSTVRKFGLYCQAVLLYSPPSWQAILLSDNDLWQWSMKVVRMAHTLQWRNFEFVKEYTDVAAPHPAGIPRRLLTRAGSEPTFRYCRKIIHRFTFPRPRPSLMRKIW